MPRTLNIGCGINNRASEEVGIDCCLSVEPTVCGDISCLPFKDESFSFIKAIHVMEHVDDIEAVMDECWRVLVFGGELFIVVPVYPSDDAIGDPTHKRYFIPRTFGYFIHKGRLPRLKHIWNAKEVIRIEKDDELVCKLKKENNA